MDTIFIDKDNFVHKGKRYCYDENEVIDKLGRKLKIIILKENLLIKNENVVFKELKRFISGYVKVNTSLDNDTLFHFEYKYSKKSLMIYSIKKGVMVEKISESAKKLIVLPIQFVIYKMIKKQLRGFQNYFALIAIDDYLYKLRVSESLLIEASCEVLNNNEVEKIIQEIDNNYLIVIDKKIIDNISSRKEEKNIKYIDLGGWNALC